MTTRWSYCSLKTYSSLLLGEKLGGGHIGTNLTNVLVHQSECKVC